MEATRRLCLALIMVVVAATAAMAQGDAVSRGQTAFDQGDYQRAFIEFRSGAEYGDANAQYMLGRMYAGGLGVTQDTVQAYRWYDIAAAQGHPDAAAARNFLTDRMTTEQVREAQRLARDWRPTAPAGAGQLRREGSLAAGAPSPPVTGVTAQATPTPAQTQTAQVQYDRPLVSGVQRELNRLGYNAGPVDGILGPRTRGAITAFQRDAGLAVDAQPSYALLDTLRATETRGVAATPAAPATPETLSRDEAVLPDAFIVAIQEELRQKGYEPGRTDGVVTQQARAAIRQYQRDAGLTVDGRVSQDLLNHLRFARPEVRRR